MVIANNKSINYGALRRLTVIEFGGFEKEKPIEIYNAYENIRKCNIKSQQMQISELTAILDSQ